MNCSRHNSREAVGQCTECGAFVCESCAKATSSLKEDCGTLCIDCYCKEFGKVKDFYQESKNKRIKRIIISCVLYVIGIIIMIISSTKDSMLMTFIGEFVCGVYTGITWTSALHQKQEEEERKHGATYVIYDDGTVAKEEHFWVKFFCFLMGSFLGIFITPIRVISDSIGISRVNKTINSLERKIRRAQKV